MWGFKDRPAKLFVSRDFPGGCSQGESVGAGSAGNRVKLFPAAMPCAAALPREWGRKWWESYSKLGRDADLINTEITRVPARLFHLH